MSTLVEIPGVGEVEFPDDMSAADIEAQAARLSGEAGPGQAAMDSTSGAPLGVRAIVGPDSRKPEDRLSTLQQYYPDAEPLGADNFAFTDPQTGQRTMMNPPGLDWGDLASYARAFVEGVGGIGGAMAGAPLGPGGVAVGAGAGATGAGALYDTGMALLTPRVDSRTTGEVLTSQAQDFAMNALFQRLADAGYAGFGKLISSKNSGARLEALKGLAQDLAQAQNIPVKQAEKQLLSGAAGAVSGNKALQGMQSTMAWLPPSARRISEAVGGTAEGLETLAKKSATDAVGGAPAPTVGQASEALQSGAQTTADAFKAAQADAYQQMLQGVGENSPVSVDFMRGMLQQLTDRHNLNPNATKFLQPAIQELRGIVDDALSGDGTIPFKVAREYMTDLGARLKEPSVATGYVGKVGQSLDKVYGALKQDLGSAAQARGPAAEAAMEGHDALVRNFAQHTEPVLSDILKRNPDQLFGWALSGSNAGAERLQHLRRVLPEGAWDTFRSGVIANMGTPSPGTAYAGDFSLSRWSSNWHRLSPEAKRVIAGSPVQHRQMNKLMVAIDSMKDALAVTNTSNTAIGNWFSNLLTGGGLGYVAGSPGVGGMAATHALARAITNPRFVKWLGYASSLPAGELPAHVARLSAIVALEPELQDYLELSARQMRRYQKPNIPALPRGAP